MLTPYGELKEGAIFVVPNETIPRLRRKREGGRNYAFGEAIPGNVPAHDLQLRENQRDCFPPEQSLLVLEIVFDPLLN